MRICYNKLQKLMIDNQMKRQDLMRAADISSYTATKINKNEPVFIELLSEEKSIKSLTIILLLGLSQIITRLLSRSILI